MIELVFAIGVLLLGHVGHGCRSDARTRRVDRLEVNQYEWTPGCWSHQVIIWEWSHFNRRYEPTRFYFVSSGGCDRPYLSGGRWYFTPADPWGRKHSVVYESADLVETCTQDDPIKYWYEEELCL